MVTDQFQCNVCGLATERTPAVLDREAASCGHCHSTVRLRSIIALLSRELFGIVIPLPAFPAIKSIRGLGMSDPPAIATLLAEKFDYTNTFYHQAPRLDVMHPEASDLGHFDFILSSEVMEHVPPPVETAFANLYRILKPDGLLFLTVPWNLSSAAEHFPALDQFDIASPGGRPVLVNRRADGSIETFEDLVFHGGPGSILEMRRFRGDELLALLANAGFRSTQILAEKIPESGIEYSVTWGFPIVARKGAFQVPVKELTSCFCEARSAANRFESEHGLLQSEYQKFVEFHDRSHAESARESEALANWGRRLDLEIAEYRERIYSLMQRQAAMERDLEELSVAGERLRKNRWVRVLRRFGLVS